MLRNKLLTTTFLIIVGSLFFAPARAAAISRDQSGGVAITAVGSAQNSTPEPKMHTEFGNPVRDRNKEFLCTYGYTVYNLFIYSSSYRASGWQRYAVPIRGKGASVSQIQVTDSEPSNSYSPEFKVGIYENRGGRPGKLIERGNGRAKGGCTDTTVTIPKTFLADGQTYWIEETVGVTHYSGDHFHAVKWGYNPNARHNAYYRYHYYNRSGSSSTTDWLPVSGPAPFVRVR